MLNISYVDVSEHKAVKNPACEAGQTGSYIKLPVPIVWLPTSTERSVHKACVRLVAVMCDSLHGAEKCLQQSVAPRFAAREVHDRVNSAASRARCQGEAGQCSGFHCRGTGSQIPTVELVYASADP